MKKIKKLGISALALMLGLGASSTLVGCGENEDNLQVMTMSVNPGIEFIVDKNDKVVSVTASNEDGAYILEKATELTGMTAKDAALKFIELSEQYGFVVSGTANGEEITISVSGDGAEKLYNDVKNKISSKVSELGLTISEMTEIDEDKLEEIVAQCYQHYSLDEIEDMSDEKLLELIKQSREETKDIYSEEERLNYYKERAEKVLAGQVEAIKNAIENNTNQALSFILSPLADALDLAYKAIDDAYDLIDTQLATIQADIASQKAEYIAQKEIYLDAVESYRDALQLNADSDTTNDVTSAQLDGLKKAVSDLRKEANDKYTFLDDARKDMATEILTKVKSTIHTNISNLHNAMNAILKHIEVPSQEMEAEIQSQIDALVDTYENSSTSPWTQDN